MISLKDIHFSYEKPVLKSLNFEINQNQIIGLTGENGSGKTTLLGLIAGLLKPDSGKITSTSTLTGWYAVGEGLYSHLTVQENLELFSHLYQSKPDRLHRLIQDFRIDHLKNQRFCNLSLGQKAKCTLVKTFLPKCSLYLLDEPFSGLDDLSIDYLLNQILKIKKEGAAFVIASHQKDVLSKICDLIFCLNQGSLQ